MAREAQVMGAKLWVFGIENFSNSLGFIVGNVWKG